MANQVLMQFASAGGAYQFGPDEVPLFSRRVDYMRPLDQGYGGRKLICTLSGFFEGKEHTDIIGKYKQLINVIKANDVTFTYRGDNTTLSDVMVEQRVYMDDYVEPTDWKEYQGDYNLTFHYFEQPTAANTLGIIAKYQPKLNSKQQDPAKPDIYVSGGDPAAYTFDPVPYWDCRLATTREDWHGEKVTAYGRSLANEMSVTLTGRLHSDSHANLKKKIDALHKAFEYDGQLTYGEFINDVKVVDISIPTTFPRDYVDYQITLKYNTSGVLKFVSKRRIARLHNFPKITELPWCNTVRVKEFAPLGQQINYYIQLQATSMATCRSLLVNEAKMIVIPNGIELDGGTQEEDDNTNTITLSFSKYYKTPVLSNIENS